MSEVRQQEENLNPFRWGVPFKKPLPVADDLWSSKPSGAEEEESASLHDGAVLLDVFSIFS